jgi:hypothetical protein
MTNLAIIECLRTVQNLDAEQRGKDSSTLKPINLENKSNSDIYFRVTAI